MVRLQFLVAFPIVFVFICDRYRQRRVLKFKKNGPLWFVSPKILSRSVGNLHYICKQAFKMYFKVRA